MPDVIRSPRQIVVLLVASATMMLAAACAGSDAETSDPGESTGGGNPMAAYTQCLQENGITLSLPSGGPQGRPSGMPGGPGGPPSGMPRPSGNAGAPGGGIPGGGGFDKPDGVDEETWNKAQSACASVRPSFGGGRPGNNSGGADAAYRNCLQENGVGATETANTTDPTVAEAMEKCEVLRPTASATPPA